MKTLSVLVAAILALWLASCATSTSAINFGDDANPWANNGICDDPRFSGPGRAYVLNDAFAYHDASDCRALYQRGQIQFRRVQQAVAIDGMDFGDDASAWAYNGECDDPRFSGPGAARKLAQGDRFHDAADCSNLYQRGDIQLAPGEAGTRKDAQTRIRIDGIDFGDDMGSKDFKESKVFNDECDDPRFSDSIHAGRIIGQYSSERFHDATDCSALYRRGLLYLEEDPRTMAPRQTLQSGETRNGRLRNYGYMDYYRYQGSADTLVMINLISFAFETYLAVVSPSGERWSNDSADGAQQLTLRLSETGEYQVEAGSDNSVTNGGAYTLTLKSAAVIADDEYEGSLQSGDDILDTGEYADTWTFTGKRGELVSINLRSDEFDTFLILRAPDGTLESNNYADLVVCNTCNESFLTNSRIERELPMTGTYTVRVTSHAAGETGAYRLRILRSESLTNN